MLAEDGEQMGADRLLTSLPQRLDHSPRPTPVREGQSAVQAKPSLGILLPVLAHVM